MKKRLLATLMLLSLYANAQITVQLKPNAQQGKDVFINSECQNTNACNMSFGSVPHICVSTWTFGGSPGVVRALIDFDWSLIPQGASIQNAQLKLFAFNGENGSQEFHSEISGSNESWLERVISPWGEHTVTFNTAPQTTTQNRVSVMSTDSVNHDFDINVTQLVNDMFSNPSTSHGFCMKLQNESFYRRLGFCSSDNSDEGKWPEMSLTFDAPGVTGIVYNDLNEDCQHNPNEIGLSGRIIEIQPGGYTVMTNDLGLWHVNLPVGTYTATLLSPGNGWSATCAMQQNFTVTDPNTGVYLTQFGLNPTVSCSSPSIAIYSNIIRRCFSEQEIYVHAENTFNASEPLTNAYAQITLDPLFTLDSASIPFTTIGAGLYQFNLGTLQPNQSTDFTLFVTLSCDAQLLQTLCYEAELFPAETCAFDTIYTPPSGDVTPCELPWDHSSLSVNGWCANDSIYFTITNTGDPGDGDMQCFSPVRVYVDGQLIILDSVQLLGGETVTYVFAGTAQTWILEADQHPLHPGNSHPNAHVENCGTGTWTPDLINNFPQDDADPVVDIFCSVTNGAYDPNDKRGFPNGITENHYIKPNQDLEYIIRFQNTGTDTAFLVVVQDTLDPDLDITSITLGNVSHQYEFTVKDSRVLEWRFENILLVDSTTNEPGSHGFIQFTVKQLTDLPAGTELNNAAAIYFDFNEAVITNTTSHIIEPEAYLSVSPMNDIQLPVSVYPNPFKGELVIASESTNGESYTYRLLDMSGKSMASGKLDSGKIITLSGHELQQGMYLLQIESTNGQASYKVIKN